MASETQAPAADAPVGSVWRIGAFRRLWLANLVSQLGDRIHQIALLWWATELTQSPATAGLLLMVTTLPVVVLSPLGGWLADHWGRRPLMVASDLFRFVVAAVFAYLALTGTLTLTAATVISLVLAAGSALFNPAAMAIIPDVVDEAHLAQANSWQELTMQATGIAGPALGGILVAAWGAGYSFAGNAVSFAASALLLMTLRLAPQAAAPSETGGFAETRRLLRTRPDITWLLASFALLNFFAVPVLVYTPYYANEVFRTGATGFGLLEAAVPLGMAASALWIGTRGEPGTVATLYPLTVLVEAVAYLTMGLWPTMTSFLLALTATGAAIGLINVVVISHFQRQVPAEQLGRFMGLLMTVCMAAVPVAFGLTGVMTTWVAPTSVLIGSGLAMLAIAVLVRFLPPAPETAPVPSGP